VTSAVTAQRRRASPEATVSLVIGVLVIDRAVNILK
jgi:hypothetical protein